MTAAAISDRHAVIRAAEQNVRRLLDHEDSGHDWYHIDRVRTMAIKIALAEGVDPFLPELMALLHELPDRKIVGSGNEQQALLEVRAWLLDHKLPEAEIDEVIYVIANQSYSKSGLAGQTLDSEAGRITQDADRLEAIGAIGIARCFVYNGKHSMPMHDPRIPPRKRLTKAQYLKNDETAINHFYEKMLTLKDLMNTKTAKKIAEQRHQFMADYLEEFFAEWDGKR